MNSLFLACTVVMPLMVYMAVGGLVRTLGIVTEASFKEINEMAFKVLIPLTLFFDIYGADWKIAINPGVFVFTILFIVVEFLVVKAIVVRFVKEKRDASTLIQGIFRSNYVLFGSTIGVPLCGPNGAALVAAMAAFMVPTVNILSVVLFETMRGGSVTFRDVIVRIFKNPLVDAGILGILFSFLKIPIPELLATPLMKLGSAATPLALVTLGGLLSFQSMVSHKKYLLSAIAGRLVIVPVIIVTIAILAGFRGDALVVIFAVFASPTAVASTPMAQSMGGNGALAGEIVATSSLCSILTIFLFVVALSGMGFIG